MNQALSFLKSFYINDTTMYCRILEMEEHQETEMVRQLLVTTKAALELCMGTFKEDCQIIEDLLHSF